ncbi:MAG: cation diffusion facilitator family transporter [Bryobacteraceae bacterium]|nr:cation diffusion facilitator family transporter [Bryobacteraceae bacterium]
MTHSGQAAAQRAMRLSVAVGVLMLAGKCFAWWITGSAAILSDAAESVVHVAAVIFAAFSMRLSYRPASSRYQYGLERITYFSAGWEGAMICLAAVAIVATAVERWIAGVFPSNLGLGTLMVLAASVINLLLGWYLIRTGKMQNSLILVANGKHVLTDSWTSFGVVAGLLLVMWTGWQPFDPLLAILVALNILWSGGHLMWEAARGLLDYADPALDIPIQSKLDTITADFGIKWHDLRYRSTGTRTLIEVHLLFHYDLPLGRAHEIATEVESLLAASLDTPAEVITHLEAMEGHDHVHARGSHAGAPR